jgi:PAS domain S-box-containing protein
MATREDRRRRHDDPPAPAVDGTGTGREERRGLRAFSQSDEFAVAIFDALAEGVLVVDHRGRIVAMNRSAEQLLGYESAMLIGLDVRDSPWVLEDENGEQIDVEEWPIIVTLDTGQPQGRLTVTVRPDGARRIIVIIAMPLPRPGGRHWTVVSLADVTRERRAELALASSEGRFRQLVEQAPDAVIVVDAAGRIATCNQRTAEVFGYAPAELAGAPIELLVPERSRPTHQRRRDQFVEAPASRPMGAGADLSGRRKDGSEFPIEVSLGTIDTPDGTQVVAIARDVTERRRAQEMVVADKAKSEFLSRMSHELRTPLNSILGFAQLLDIGGPRDDQREALEQIQRAGHHLLDLLNDLLEFERVRAGHVSYSIEPVSVADVIVEALHLSEPLARSLDVRIPTPSQDGPWPGWALCDRLRVRQVLLNLLSNAVKYNRPDGTVQVSTVTKDGELSIAIRDTGGGIPEELRPRLFAPFERLGSDPTVEGAGVGLALSQMLVEGMGGRILVDSVPGVGRTFTVVLPATEASAGGEVVTPPTAAAGGFGRELTGVRVLCIEDNAANVRLIQAMTAVFGVAATLTATTGEAGIALAARSEPDVILLDLHLPDLPGAAVLRRLRYLESTREIPVIVVTADASPKTAAELLDAGVAQYLTKPVDAVALYEAIVAATA